MKTNKKQLDSKLTDLLIVNIMKSFYEKNGRKPTVQEMLEIMAKGDF